jgi:hypothetical protein
LLIQARCRCHNGTLQKFFTLAARTQWVCNFVIGPASGSRDVPDAVVNPVTWSTDGVLWNKEPAVVSPQTPLVLLRRRIGTQQKGGSSSSISLTGSADGLLIWIRRAGEPTGGGGVIFLALPVLCHACSTGILRVASQEARKRARQS